MFIVRNSKFKEQETKKILNLIVNLIKNEKKILIQEYKNHAHLL